MTVIAPTLESWFTDRLGRQRQASPRTIASYRDTLRLLMCFMQARTGKAPSSLDWDDLSEEAISAFLDHLETDRHNGPRTRNLRLTAIRSLFRYAALRHPEHAAVIQRVLAIPAKRFSKAAISFLTANEAAALMDAPDQRRWEGRRDRALLMLALQTGLRVSELIGLDCADVVLGAGGHVRCEGKGRRQRAVPLTSSLSTCCGPGCQNERADHMIRCSRPGPAGGSAPTPSSGAWPSTRPPRQSAARRCRPRGCTPTSSATAVPWPCCRQGLTSPSSRSGSVTPTSDRPMPTSTPTSASRSVLSH